MRSASFTRTPPSGLDHLPPKTAALRRNNPFYDANGRYIHDEERECPELAEEFVAAYDAMVACWSVGHRLRSEHGQLPPEERHRRSREMAEAERRQLAEELHRERRHIAVAARIREIVAARREAQAGGAS